MTLPTVLTIAGSDCSGGAGIQADLKTFTVHGCYGASVITALTAQNTVGVQDVYPSPPSFVMQQILSTVEDIKMDALKTGMLFDAQVTAAVVDTLKAHYDGRIPPLVCDPVCMSTSGHSLLNPDAIEAMTADLFPLAAVVTPNKSEVELLLSHGLNKPYPPIQSLDEMLAASTLFLETFASAAVLIKGGHLTATLVHVRVFAAAHPEIALLYDGPFGENMEILQIDAPDDVVIDLLHQRDGISLFVRPRIKSSSTHGTGCTLSAAIACGLAQGRPLADAVRKAAIYTHLGIETAASLGSGHGPLNHMHTISHRIVPTSTHSSPYPFTRRLIQDNQTIWKAYVQHPFVEQLAQGTLPRECFLHFIKQDYHYLKYYARAYGMLTAKSSTFPAIADATKTIMNVLEEIKHHTTAYGITAHEMDNTPESVATMAYGGYLLDVALEGDAAKLMMALLACLLGYGQVGLWISRNGVDLRDNQYASWVQDYAGERYQGAVKLGLDTIETMAEDDPPSEKRYREWCDVWQKCTRLEKGFWDMGLNLS